MEVDPARKDESPATPLTQSAARPLPAGASPAGNRARQWNRWRERYNPLRGLNVARCVSGYLPHGSDYKPNDQPRGSDPFRPRLDYLTEKLVLAGTGGLLTMLAQSGSGTLAGGAHAEAFATIARAEARQISEIFQRQFDREVLARHFPGCPAVVYFELAAEDATDPATIAEHAQKLAAAGYRINVAQLAEKTGYKLVDTQAKTSTSPEPVPSLNLDGASLDDLLLNINLRPEEIERWVTINGHRVPIRKKGSPPDAGKADQAPSKTVTAENRTAGQNAAGQAGIAQQEPKNPGFLFGLFDSPQEYLDELVEVGKGYGDAAKEMASGIKQILTQNPIETAKGFAHAALNPVETAKAILSDTAQTWQSGTRGKGKVIGGALVSIATGGVTAKAGKLAKTALAHRRRAQAVARIGAKPPEKVRANADKIVEGGSAPPKIEASGQVLADTVEVKLTPKVKRYRSHIKKEWKDQIIGLAQETETSGHRFRVYREAISMAKSGVYRRIYLNRAYSTSTGFHTSPRRLPDILAIRENWIVDAIEVPSKSDVRKVLLARNLHAMKQLPEGMRGQVIIRFITKTHKQ